MRPPPASLTLCDARSAGIPVWAFETGRFHRLTHGLYVPAGSAEDLRSRCLMLLRVLPGGSAFSGPTAAQLRGWRQPQWPEAMPVCVDVPETAGNPKRRGLRVNHGRLPQADFDEVHGIPVTTPARTLADLAALVGLPDLVIMLDHALSRDRTLMDALRELAGRRGRRGVRLLRQGLALADRRAESAGESLLRVVHQMGRIPVEPQAAIFGRDGEWLARADLRIKGTRRLHEYDGAVHRDARTHARDLSRDRTLAREGYVRYGYTMSSLGTPHHIMVDAEDALGWPHDPNRADAWLAAYRRSLLNPRMRQHFARYGRLPPVRPASARRGRPRRLR